MPKLKKSPAVICGEIINVNIRTAAYKKGCTSSEDIAQKVGLSGMTVRNHMKDPKMWTVGQLLRVTEVFGVKFSWLVTDHSKEVET